MDDVERLITQVLNESVEISRNAIFTLERSGDPRAVPAICNALRVHPSRIVRAAAAGTLGHLRDPRAIPSLTGALRDDNWDTRWLSLDALRQIGVQPLLNALNGLPETALQSLREPHKELAKCGTAAIEPLIATLRQSNDTMRCIAAIALGEVGDMRALPDLERMARTVSKLAFWNGQYAPEIVHDAIEKIRTRAG